MKFIKSCLNLNNKYQNDFQTFVKIEIIKLKIKILVIKIVEILYHKFKIAMNNNMKRKFNRNMKQEDINDILIDKEEKLQNLEIKLQIMKMVFKK